MENELKNKKIMASNGLNDKAKYGTCRICQRVRNTDKHINAVGEVRHGFATGHIWECIDVNDCDKVAVEKLNNDKLTAVTRNRIQVALIRGRATEYLIMS